ncbi:translation initiation factor aIF-2 [Paracoccidioides brasiliensis Pb18]|uniref:Eukaryotic translation initiation factor 5B n=1 Tax=Paracoccidioides brasiliensis (strain Pb18) TaxID=502780 RepID=C1GLA9_PARBD|nr:translation initiation factor aIF-2 [Paracoccidioides brasiliensis Pb18]EEH43075.1 translation initiation factor aIF-2 [Paracoccidioides brasiliensis Pb18]
MAPKKKGSKKQQESWEAELGETVPAATTTADATTAADANDDDAANNANKEKNKNEDDGMDGGLLAALKKNRSKKAKRSKGADNDFVEGEDPMASAASAAAAAADDASKQPQEGSFEGDEDDVFSGNASARQRAKDKAAALREKAAESKEAEERSRIKSKKEKEKERKEREKQRKKEQAAKKKTAAPAAAPAPKAETAKPVAEEKPQAPAAAPPAAETGGKKKKLPAHLAAIQRQQEALRKQQEEIARLEAEEKAAAEERQRQWEEEERKKEEARQRRKEKEREKKEQLRKEGKLLTKAQKEAQQRNELRKQQMLAAGAVVAGLEAELVERKKPVYENKKKRSTKKQEDDLEAAAARAEAQRLELEAERAKKEEEERKRAEEKAAAEAAAAKEAEVGGIKESWDMSSDEEQEEAEPATNGAKKAEGSGKNSEQQSEEEESSEEESDEETTANQRAIAQRKAEAAERRRKQHEEALAARSADNLRSPICCILGHVDTGKTKLLDKIRQTNVQEGEAGGITQQIGATYFPVDALQQKTAVVNKDGSFEFKVPGLLVIDTPGHESFSNLRSRGSSLCNIAILVVDIMHGLEPQTLESMKLLRDRKTPFIVALNKIDRLYGWKKIDNNGIQDSLALQNKGVQNEFRDRVDRTKLAFAEQGFNSELYWENKSMARNVSLVPTSAHTGEGVPDMLKLLVALTQERMTKQLMYLTEVECTVLEVKVIEGLGTTIDVVLSNGVLREGDRIVLCGLNGAIATNIRALLTPAPLKELRLKSQYVHNKEVKAALGVKIAANDLEHAIAGSRLLVVGPDDDEEDLEDEVMSDLENLLSKVSKDNRGVSVQASTLGSLEALLEFLRVSKIPVANISIGPVYKRDVMRAGTMLEKAKQFAVMLCFDVKVDKEAQAYADEVGIKIFTADIIYHLFDDFTKHMQQITEQKKEESKLLAVFPCVLRTVAVFNKKDPIVIGVDVVEGSLRMLTPIAAVKNNPVTGVKEIINLGRVQSIEREHKQIPLCKKGQPSVAIKIEGPNQPLYGRQLEESDTLYSLISRPSIDTLKEFYRPEVSMDEWVLIKKLKPLFDIP